MLNKNRLAALLSLPLLILAAGAALQEPARKAPTPEEMKAMEAQAMALMMPGPEHEQLAKFAGTWNADVSIFMAPGTEALKTSNVTTSSMVLGGRFLQVEASGEFMDMPFASLSMMGFDRRSGEYTTVGFDTLSTYYVTAAGKWDDATKSLTMYGEDHDAALEHTQKYNFIFKWIDDDTYTMAVEFLDEMTTMGQGPFTMVETTYTRK